MTAPSIAHVIICREGWAVDRLFDYQIPPSQDLQIGHACIVPFGKGDREAVGIIAAISQKSDWPNLKAIIRRGGCSDLTPISLELAIFIRNKYVCTYYEALKLFLPPGGKVGTKAPAERYKKVISAVPVFDQTKLDKYPVQKKAFLFIRGNPCLTAEELTKVIPCSRSVLEQLYKKQFIEIKEIAIPANPLANKEFPKDQPKIPTKQQQLAIDAINAAEDYHCFLIHGITGSGKTEVYLQTIQKVLDKGKTALALVPEISLTPQLINIFAKRFGKRIAVLHSRLSDRERFDQWNQVKKGMAQVVIGARSAIFAPLDNLGIIVVDEEHEQTYKSETAPRYNARELAVKLARLHNAKCVLASATPSIESFYAAKSGQITLLNMTNRINSRPLPEAIIVDMRSEIEEGNRSSFSFALREAINENIQNGRQTILFLNRRGYNTFVCCKQCGFVAYCNECSIPMTFHKSGSRLVCHYCGGEQSLYLQCPQCASNSIKHYGTGTQKIEEEIENIFPNASYIRMDMDTTYKKGAHEEILKRFQKEKIDILLGTQMISKGLDFDSVTLVGVMAADISLNAPDFRADERTFALVAQVLGRAGRGEFLGKAIIQTFNPESPTLILAGKQDYVGFYNQEINMRRVLAYPPFCNIINIVISSPDENLTKAEAHRVYELIRHDLEKQEINTKIYPPKEAAIYKIKNKFRYHFWLKCRLHKDLLEIIRQHAAAPKKATITIDINATRV